MLPLCFARLEFKVYGWEFKVLQTTTFFELAVYISSWFMIASDNVPAECIKI
jgi:hypothetical protein